MKRVLSLLLILGMALAAHEGGTRSRKPTKAEADLKRAKVAMAAAKAKLQAAGKYSCCARPGCDSCVRAKGSCDCAANRAAGRGVCGECYARLRSQGESEAKVHLHPTLHGADAIEGSVASAELLREVEALTRAKRTLVEEKRYTCCVRGGCGQCAHEGDCPCGSDLASAGAKRKGVCGECADGWHSGRGAFEGIPLSDVTVAIMPSMAGSMSPTSAGGWYASGTSQAPRDTPMNMLHWRFGSWNVMLQGVFFGAYTNQTGERGRDKIFSTNWFMPMVSRRVGPGVLTFRSMLSLEPATVTKGRYPLLLQTGETNDGIPIINGQHPHDLFMELGASYHLPISERTALNLYGGPRGEPALGPTAFPHRLSNSENPVAVLAHHYQDSTHIATNVVTLGLTHRAITLEASGFHGREPDEKRWGIEGGAVDSFSARLTVVPSTRWSGQFSLGRINNREPLHPVRDSFRTSASMTYARALSGGHWVSTLAWGRNQDLAYTQPPNTAPPIFGFARLKHFVTVPTRIPEQIYNSYLAESTVFLRNKHWIWGRVENTDKDTLLLFEEDPFAVLVDERRFTRVQSYTVGYERELPSFAGWLSQGVGGQVMVFATGKDLAPIYGAYPVGVQMFMRFRFRRALP